MAVFCRINYDEKDWSLIAKQLLTNTQVIIFKLVSSKKKTNKLSNF